MNQLFIYGTLRDRDICEAVLLRAVAPDDMIAASAPDFAIYKVADVHYPCLLPADGQVAVGALLTGLSDEDLALLDQFEGVNYSRKPIGILVDGKEIETQYYQPNKMLRTDGAWSLAQWQKQGKADFLGRDFHKNGVRVPPHA